MGQNLRETRARNPKGQAPTIAARGLSLGCYGS